MIFSEQNRNWLKSQTHLQLWNTWMAFQTSIGLEKILEYKNGSLSLGCYELKQHDP
jgi:hypothetical protein